MKTVIHARLDEETEKLLARLRRRTGKSDSELENVERGVFLLPFRLDSVAAPVRSLLRKYARVPMDLADACLVQMADALETGRILTLDGDFLVYRWRKNRRFELLLDLEWPI